MAIKDRGALGVGSRVVVDYGKEPTVRYVVEVVAGDEKNPLKYRLVEPTEWSNPFGVDKGGKAGLPDGRTFTSLSTVGDAITFPKIGPSPYVFFTPVDEIDAEKQAKVERVEARATAKAEREAKEAADKQAKAERREQAKAERQAAKESKKAARVRKTGYLLLKVLEDGRAWCDGCMATFGEPGQYSADNLPEDCPNGHIKAGVEDFVNNQPDAVEGDGAKPKRTRKAKAKPEAEPATA